VFVVGKNYRVQNIQLSKIRLAGLCRQSVYVGCAWCATEAALNKASPDVGVRETHKPHSLTETFSASTLRALARQARKCAVVVKICSPHQSWLA